jgi:hypothetical protein
VSIGHSSREAKFVIIVVVFLTLHADRVVFGLRMILFTLLIKGDFTKYSLTKLSKNFVDTFLDVLAGFVRLISDFLRHFIAAIHLGLSELVNSFWFGRCQSVNESLL